MRANRGSRRRHRRASHSLSPSRSRAPAPAYAPAIATDQLDYLPGAPVTLTGTGWIPGDPVHICVTEDTPIASWTLSSDPDPVADAGGGFTFPFTLPSWFVAHFRVEASDGATTVTAYFTDLNGGTHDQCSNDDGDGYDGDPGMCKWINGNLQRNNSVYMEGDATVQRLWLTDLVPGSTHTVTLKYGTTKGGKHAYDCERRQDVQVRPDVQLLEAPE